MLSVLTSPKLPWSLAKGTVLICNDKLADRSSRLLGSSSHTRFFKRDCFGCVTEHFQKSHIKLRFYLVSVVWSIRRTACRIKYEGDKCSVNEIHEDKVDCRGGAAVHHLRIQVHFHFFFFFSPIRSRAPLWNKRVRSPPWKGTFITSFLHFCSSYDFSSASYSQTTVFYFYDPLFSCTPSFLTCTTILK